MGRKRSSGPAEKKRRRVNIQLLQREHAGKVTEAYRIMEDLLKTVHGHLRDLKIAIAWRANWRPNTDGYLRMGQLKMRKELDRELDSFDYVLLLNKEAWPTLSDDQKKALIDHELCHGQIVMDADGEPKQDDRGRLCLRVRKHDIEEFQDVIDRNGFCTSILSKVAKAAIADADRPLLAGLEDDNAEGDQGGDGEIEAVEAPDVKPDAWKRLSVSHLGLPDKLTTALAEHKKPIKTLGQFQKHLNDHGEWWAREIEGFGKVAKEKVGTAWMKFWADHPEYCK